MGRSFSNKEVETIRNIVNQVLVTEKHKHLVKTISVLYVLLGIGSSILTVALMPKLIRKGAGKFYKKQLKKKLRTNTAEE